MVIETGYGIATGKPSEKQMQEDITAVFNHATSVYSIAPHDIVLMGRSLGTGPTCYLAARRPVSSCCMSFSPSRRVMFTLRVLEQVKAVILHSPFLSILQTQGTCCGICGMCGGDLFVNEKEVQGINSPVKVIHGMRKSILRVTL